MGFRCGIVGLPNAGKSTIFNALTAAAAEVASYPFCTIEPNVGIVTVPDERLDALARLHKPKKVAPSTLEFFDIAGLVKGASTGEGLGNQFLGHIRNVDAIAHVVRCFADMDISHLYGTIDPRRDVEIIDTELILADLEAVDRRLEKVKRLLKVGEKGAAEESHLLEAIKECLDRGQRAGKFIADAGRTLPLDLQLLTAKPIFYVANVDDPGRAEQNQYLKGLQELTKAEGTPVVVIAGKLEAEVAQLGKEEQEEFRRGLGLVDSGLKRLIRVGYDILGLVTFFTTANQDLRAWTVPRGTPALQAAGKIHSDMERGFIKAEVVSFEDLMRCGSEHVAKEKGLLKAQGKDYVVQDGDIIHFRFNV
ncbi:MAG: redox-regulated ATPase YchF [Deltaproteobacteria bacterium RBG_16_54_11]|nr:MAG: redox-regulated ATPase YchF [Deltaproteobacteria bacterium RBG_16_54_11]